MCETRNEAQMNMLALREMFVVLGLVRIVSQMGHERPRALPTADECVIANVKCRNYEYAGSLCVWAHTFIRDLESRDGADHKGIVEHRKATQ